MRGVSRFWAAALLALATALHAQSPTCASCHVSIARSQPATPMGRALQLPGANPSLANHPKLTFQRGMYTYTVETRAGHSTYSVSDGTSTITLPIEWAFGANNQTFVLERDGKLYESLVSFYQATGALDVTTGDDTLVPRSLAEAIGREQGVNDAKACFGCHATGAVHDGAVHDGGLDLKSLTPGLGCEHCHTGSAQHLKDALFKKLDTSPPDLGALSSEDLSGFCAQCHRSWETVVRSRWTGPMNVRFQPYRLANSRCFNGTDPRISCVACHDPHGDLKRTPASYDPQCLACHNAKPNVAPKTASGAEMPKICPVAKSQCATCHMPKVTLPHSGGHLTFTDHEIRVVRPGDAYPN
jgi:nitrate/TMAO reductase-like tetraheme cytochrome c subunit